MLRSVQCLIFQYSGLQLSVQCVNKWQPQAHISAQLIIQCKHRVIPEVCRHASIQTSVYTLSLGIAYLAKNAF